ncbi:MAG: LysR family transcriptional regulator [Pontibacterium sp.]
MNAPNIRHLRAFIAVSKTKSISKATDIVFLSQPAITQALSKLEDNFEATLFDRKSDGMYVTESGKVLGARVERAMEMIMDGIRDAVRIGGSESTAKVKQLFNVVTTTQLRAIIAVSASRSFSVAGRTLGLSQSSLHRSSRALEDLLGVELFEKTSVGISPTKAALVLSKAAKLALSEIEQGREEIYSLNNREIGHIVIGSMPLARTSVLPNTIIEFSESYPDFRISINDGPYTDLLYHLRHADIDLLIGALRFPPPSDDVVQQELFSSKVVIVARPDHPFRHLEQLTLAQLGEASWVVPRVGTPTRKIFDTLFEEAGMELPRRLVESSSQLLIRSLLEGSDRMTMLSAHQVQRELSEGSLAVMPFLMPHAFRPIGMTMRKGWQPTATQQALINTLIGKSKALSDEDL